MCSSKSKKNRALKNFRHCSVFSKENTRSQHGVNISIYGQYYGRDFLKCLHGQSISRHGTEMNPVRHVKLYSTLLNANGASLYEA